MEHETRPLKEEMQLLHEINVMKKLRGQISSNVCSQEEVTQALNEVEPTEIQLKVRVPLALFVKFWSDLYISHFISPCSEFQTSSYTLAVNSLCRSRNIIRMNLLYNHVCWFCIWHV